jgi:hypothetical protein
VAYTLKMWTKISFISKEEFLAYKPGSTHQGKFGRTKSTDGTSLIATAVKEQEGLIIKYNSRQSTVEKRGLMQIENDLKQDKGAQGSKDDKDAKAIQKLKDQLQTAKDEKAALKKINSDMKAARKAEIDSAVSRAELKADSKIDSLSKQLDVTQKNLLKANGKIKSLEESASKVVSYSSFTSRPTDNRMKTPVLVEEKKAAPDSTATNIRTPAIIASEYKDLATLVGSTNAAIEINRIETEASIQLAKLGQNAKLEVMLILELLYNSFDF